MAKRASDEREKVAPVSGYVSKVNQLSGAGGKKGDPYSTVGVYRPEGAPHPIDILAIQRPLAPPHRRLSRG